MDNLREEQKKKLTALQNMLNGAKTLISENLSKKEFEDSRKALEGKILSFLNRIHEIKTRFDPLLHDIHTLKTLKEHFLDHEEKYIDF